MVPTIIFILLVIGMGFFILRRRDKDLFDKIMVACMGAGAVVAAWFGDLIDKIPHG